MSTQAITAVCYSPTGGRSFSVTATDDTFSNFALTDTGAATLGFGMTNQLITHVQATYVGGGMAWRIRDSVSQVTKRVGFGFKVGATGPSPYSGSMAPLTVNQNDILEIYSVAVP
tara:strand:+ start:435 stop:779 length:345 start_codon:yes stop_codon:yes gene_type:complete